MREYSNTQNKPNAITEKVIKAYNEGKSSDINMPLAIFMVIKRKNQENHI